MSSARDHYGGDSAISGAWVCVKKEARGEVNTIPLGKG